MLDKLPQDIQNNIFSFLNRKALIISLLISKQLNLAVHNYNIPERNKTEEMIKRSKNLKIIDALSLLNEAFSKAIDNKQRKDIIQEAQARLKPRHKELEDLMILSFNASINISKNIDISGENQTLIQQLRNWNNRKDKMEKLPKKRCLIM